MFVFSGIGHLAKSQYRTATGYGARRLERRIFALIEVFLRFDCGHLHEIGAKVRLQARNHNLVLNLNLNGNHIIQIHKIDQFRQNLLVKFQYVNERHSSIQINIYIY